MTFVGGLQFFLRIVTNKSIKHSENPKRVGNPSGCADVTKGQHLSQNHVNALEKDWAPRERPISVLQGITIKITMPRIALEPSTHAVGSPANKTMTISLARGKRQKCKKTDLRKTSLTRRRAVVCVLVVDVACGRTVVQFPATRRFEHDVFRL